MEFVGVDAQTTVASVPKRKIRLCPECVIWQSACLRTHGRDIAVTCIHSWISSIGTPVSPQPEDAICRFCGSVCTLHRHDVSVHNRDHLLCPACGKELIAWDGKVFYTFAVTPSTTEKHSTEVEGGSDHTVRPNI